MTRRKEGKEGRRNEGRKGRKEGKDEGRKGETCFEATSIARCRPD